MIKEQRCSVWDAPRCPDQNFSMIDLFCIFLPSVTFGECLHFSCPASLTTYEVTQGREQWLVRVRLVVLPVSKPRPDFCHCLIWHGDSILKSGRKIMKNIFKTTSDYKETWIMADIYWLYSESPSQAKSLNAWIGFKKKLTRHFINWYSVTVLVINTPPVNFLHNLRTPTFQAPSIPLHLWLPPNRFPIYPSSSSYLLCPLQPPPAAGSWGVSGWLSSRDN